MEQECCISGSNPTEVQEYYIYNVEQKEKQKKQEQKVKENQEQKEQTAYYIMQKDNTLKKMNVNFLITNENDCSLNINVICCDELEQEEEQEVQEEYNEQIEINEQQINKKQKIESEELKTIKKKLKKYKKDLSFYKNENEQLKWKYNNLSKAYKYLQKKYDALLQQNNNNLNILSKLKEEHTNLIKKSEFGIELMKLLNLDKQQWSLLKLNDKEFLQWVIDGLTNKNENKNFIWKFIQEQAQLEIKKNKILLKNGNSEDNAKYCNRYSDILYHLAFTIQYYGGKKLLEILNNNKNGKSLHIPSLRSLIYKLPEFQWQSGKIFDFVKPIIKLLDGENIFGGISFDEMDIKKSIYLSPTGEVYGMKGNKYNNIKNLLELPINTLRNVRATHMLMFFWTSTNGNISFPLAMIPTTKGKSKIASWYEKKIINLIQELQSLNSKIKVEWTSSDCWNGVHEFQKLMQNKEIYHFGDWIHLIKKLRNMLERPLHTSASFGLKDIFYYYNKDKDDLTSPLYNKEGKQCIRIDDICIRDKMKPRTSF